MLFTLIDDILFKEKYKIEVKNEKRQFSIVFVSNIKK